MSKELFFLGQPVEFKAGIKIYPPKVKDVFNKKYPSYLQVLTYTHEEIEDLYVEEEKNLESFPSPLEFLLNNCYHDNRYEKICKESFQFFIKQPVEFLYEQKLILVGNLEDILSSLDNLSNLVTISEEEFFDFQNLIRASVNSKLATPPEQNLHPKVKAMKAKARYRDRIKAKQNAKHGLSLFTAMASICCMGLGITPLNIGELSYSAMDAILNQFQAKERYEVDIQSLLAGADSKPKYWIRNLEDDE